jgi:hypothetical protein
MSDPRGGIGRDKHIQESTSWETSSAADARGDTRSETYHADNFHRETMQQELMDLGAWLSEHPKAAKKNLKPVRGAIILDPGFTTNTGKGIGGPRVRSSARGSGKTALGSRATPAHRSRRSAQSLEGK